MVGNWQPWATAPIHNEEVTLLVAMPPHSAGGKVWYSVYKRRKISNGYMASIGSHFDFDEETPLAWSHFNEYVPE